MVFGYCMGFCLKFPKPYPAQYAGDSLATALSPAGQRGKQRLGWQTRTTAKRNKHGKRSIPRPIILLPGELIDAGSMPKNGGRRSREYQGTHHSPSSSTAPLFFPPLALARTSQRQRRPQSPVKIPWRLSGQRTLIPWPKAIGTFLSTSFVPLKGVCLDIPAVLSRSSAAIPISHLFLRGLGPGSLSESHFHRSTLPCIPWTPPEAKEEDGLYVFGERESVFLT